MLNLLNCWCWLPQQFLQTQPLFLFCEICGTSCTADPVFSIIDKRSSAQDSRSWVLPARFMLCGSSPETSNSQQLTLTQWAEAVLTLSPNSPKPAIAYETLFAWIQCCSGLIFPSKQHFANFLACLVCSLSYAKKFYPCLSMLFPCALYSLIYTCSRVQEVVFHWWLPTSLLESCSLGLEPPCQLFLPLLPTFLLFLIGP